MLAEAKNAAVAMAIPPATIAQPGRRFVITTSPQHRSSGKPDEHEHPPRSAGAVPLHRRPLVDVLYRADLAAIPLPRAVTDMPCPCGCSPSLARQHRH